MAVKKAGNAPEAGELYMSAGRCKAFQSRAVSCFFAFSFKPGPASEEGSRRGILRCWEAAGRKGNLIRPQKAAIKVLTATHLWRDPPPLSPSKAVRRSLSEQGRRGDRFCGPSSKRKENFQPGSTLGDCAWASNRPKAPLGVWRLFLDPGPALCARLILHFSTAASVLQARRHLQT